MQRSPAALSRALALSALLLAQCGTVGPALPRVLTVSHGERTRVMLVQSSGPALTLQNDSAAARSEVYSDTAGDVTTKVVEDGVLQTLLDVLAQQGFFERAAPSPLPGAREAIAIHSGDRMWVLSRMPLRNDDDVSAIQAFHECRGYVMEVYNRTTAYHSGQGLTGEDLKREKEAMERRGASTKDKYRGGDQGKRERPPR